VQALGLLDEGGSGNRTLLQYNSVGLQFSERLDARNVTTVFDNGQQLPGSF